MWISRAYAARGRCKGPFLTTSRNPQDPFDWPIDYNPARGVALPGPRGPPNPSNQPCLDYTGPLIRPSPGMGWTSLCVHPDDVESLLETWRAIWIPVCEARPEARPSGISSGDIAGFFVPQPAHLARLSWQHRQMGHGSGTDIEDPQQDRKLLMRQSEAYLAQASD